MTPTCLQEGRSTLHRGFHSLLLPARHLLSFGSQKTSNRRARDELGLGPPRYYDRFRLSILPDRYCSCSAIMSPPNCSGKVSPPKLGGGLESKAVTKVGGDRKRGRRASECEGGGRSVGAQRAAGEAAEAGLR